MSPSSYADLRRDDENIEGQSCDAFYFKSTGLEVDPVRAICECMLSPDFKRSSGINQNDRNTLRKLFIKYRNAHPEDCEAQEVGPKDLVAIAKFLLSYDYAYSDFMRLMAKSPDDEHLIDIERNGIRAIVQFMRSYRLRKFYSNF